MDSLDKTIDTIRALDRGGEKQSKIYNLAVLGDVLDDYEMSDKEKAILDLVQKIRTESDPALNRGLVVELMDIIADGQYVLKYSVGAENKIFFLNRLTAERLFRLFVSEQPVTKFEEINMGEYMCDVFNPNSAATVNLVMDVGKYTPGMNYSEDVDGKIRTYIDDYVNVETGSRSYQYKRLLTRIGKSVFAVHYIIDGEHKTFNISRDVVRQVNDIYGEIDDGNEIDPNEYEPYVGDIFIPDPDRPAEITTIVRIRYEGKRGKGICARRENELKRMQERESRKRGGGTTRTRRFQTEYIPPTTGAGRLTKEEVLNRLSPPEDVRKRKTAFPRTPLSRDASPEKVPMDKFGSLPPEEGTQSGETVFPRPRKEFSFPRKPLSIETKTPVLASPRSREPSQVRREPSPVRREPSPIRREPSPIRREPSPVRREPSPIRREPSPIRREPSPIRREPSPVRSRGPIVKNVAASVPRSAFGDSITFDLVTRKGPTQLNLQLNS